MTLVELLVALGVLAFGVGAVMALLAAGAGTARRAAARIEEALVAEQALAEARSLFGPALDRDALERVPELSRAGRPVYALWQGKPLEGDGLPGLVSDLLVCPIDAEEPGEASAFHVEIRLRYRERGRRQAATWHTVLTRRIFERDLKAPPRTR